MVREIFEKSNLDNVPAVASAIAKRNAAIAEASAKFDLAQKAYDDACAERDAVIRSLSREVQIAKLEAQLAMLKQGV